jgi:hypothetical protein
MTNESNHQQDSDKETLKIQIETLLASCNGEKINICYAIYRLIEKGLPEDIPDILQFTADIYDKVESCEKIFAEAYINKNEVEVLKSHYGEVVDEMLKSLINEDLIELEFYKKLWDTIKNPFFKDEKSRVFAFYYILIDKRMPYFHLDQGLKMTSIDFTMRAQKLSNKAAKIRFILAREFSQRTEEAFLILQEIDAEEETEDRAVLMAHLIALFRQREAALMEAFQSQPASNWRA